MNHSHCPLFTRLLVGALILAPFTTSALTWERSFQNRLSLKPSAVLATEDAYWIGGRGFVASSSDGEDWNLELETSIQEFSAMASWNDSILAGSRAGTIFQRAPGSETWTETPLEHPLIEFEVGDDRVIALTTGSVAISTDLVSWTEVPELPEGVMLKQERVNGVLNIPFFTPDHLAYGNGLFVLSGEGTRTIWTSADGLTWEQEAMELPSGMAFDGKIFHQDGIWLATARNRRIPSLLRSTDLVNWKEIRLNGAYQILGFAGHSGEILVWARQEEAGLSAYHSTDGIEWSQAIVNPGLPGTRPVFPSIVSGPEGYLAIDLRIGDYDYLGARLRSPDGLAWTELNSFLDREPADYIRTGKAAGWVFYSAPLTGIVTTPDGSTWYPVTPPGETRQSGGELDSVTYLEGTEMWYLLDSNGRLLESNDGSTWNAQSYLVSGASGEQQLFDVATFGNALYAIARPSEEEDGVLVTSTEGTTWTQVGPSGIPASSQLLATADGLLIHTPEMPIAVSFNSTFGSQKTDLYSVDGYTWEELETELDGGKIPREPFRVQVLGNDFCAVTRDGRIRLWSKSEGPREVQARTANDFLNVQSVTMTDVGNYAVFTSNNELAIGPDLQWLTIIPSPLPGGVKTIIAQGKVLLTLTLDSAYYPEVEKEDYWSFTGQRFEHWVNTLWFGWINDQAYPFIYHKDHGWIYQVIGNDGSIWNWDTALRRWILVDPDYFPLVYVAGKGDEAGRWVYYDKNTRTPLRWFYDFYLETWVAEEDFDLTPPTLP